MCVKIEAETFIFVRTNQTKLRAENGIHLQDAIRNGEGTKNFGLSVILPSSFIDVHLM